MAARSYDCIVIGSGPGGYVAAIRAAQLGKKTAVIERDKVGGRCLNYACIPAKAVLRAADLLSEIRDSEEFGLRVSGVEVDYAAVQARREKVVSTLTSGVAGLFKKDGIDLIEGDAALTADGAVSVDGELISAPTIIVATGSVPRSIPGVEFGGRVIGTEEAWALKELPARLAVVGCGASGAEIASGFARLGSEVILLEAMDTVLPTEDSDISRLVERGLKQQGIDVHKSSPVADVQATGEGVSFTYGAPGADGDGAAGAPRAEVDFLVIAAGRGADIEALGLAEAGVELEERGLVGVDGAMRTSRPGVYAIGDLVAGPALAHKASDEGIIAAEDSAGLQTHPLAYVDIPRATFCTPNVGSFGLTEAQAREEGYDVVVGKAKYGAVGGGIVYGDPAGLVKVVGERKYGELLGGHIVGARATELIQELVNVRDAGGRLHRGRADRPRPPHAVGGRDGSRPRSGRLVDPRLIVSDPPASFYFDLASPEAYLAAERILQLLPRPGRVAAGARLGAPRRGATRRDDRDARADRRAARASSACSRCAGPSRSRSTATLAMRVATYAKSIGRAVPFAQAAFRQAFAGGHSLGEPDYVLIAAAACEMHPAAVLRGAELRSVERELATATAARCRRGHHRRPRDQGRRARVPGRAGGRGRRRTHGRRRQPGRLLDGVPVRANRAYRLILTRGGRAPALLADAERVDHIEVVEIDGGEVVLFWDRPPHAASRLARALRAELRALEAEEFIARWSTVEH